jgi:hypothetical protein
VDHPHCPLPHGFQNNWLGILPGLDRYQTKKTTSAKSSAPAKFPHNRKLMPTENPALLIGKIVAHHYADAD